MCQTVRGQAVTHPTTDRERYFLIRVIAEAVWSRIYNCRRFIWSTPKKLINMTFIAVLLVGNDDMRPPIAHPTFFLCLLSDPTTRDNFQISWQLTGWHVMPCHRARVRCRSSMNVSSLKFSEIQRGRNFFFSQYLKTLAEGFRRSEHESDTGYCQKSTGD